MLNTPHMKTFHLHKPEWMARTDQDTVNYYIVTAIVLAFVITMLLLANFLG